MSMLIQLIIAGLVFWCAITVLIYYFMNLQKIVKNNEKKDVVVAKNKPEIDQRKFDLKTLNKDIYWIADNIKYDKEKRPDYSFDVLKDLKNIIEKAYENKNISAAVYDKFTEALFEIIKLIIESINKKREIKKLTKNSQFRQTLKDQREKILDKIDELTNTLSSVVTEHVVDKINLDYSNKIIELKEELIIDKLHKEKLNELNLMLEGIDKSSSIDLNILNEEPKKEVLKITHDSILAELNKSAILSVEELVSKVERLR